VNYVNLYSKFRENKILDLFDTLFYNSPRFIIVFVRRLLQRGLIVITRKYRHYDADAPLERIIGITTTSQNSEATGHKWMLFGTKMPDAPVVAEIKRPRKKAQAKGEAGMLDGYVNPTDELKGGIERMAVNA